jgi:hypothetical protein
MVSLDCDGLWTDITLLLATIVSLCLSTHHSWLPYYITWRFAIWNLSVKKFKNKWTNILCVVSPFKCFFSLFWGHKWEPITNSIISRKVLSCKTTRIILYGYFNMSERKVLFQTTRHFKNKKQTPWPVVRKRTIPTERSPLAGEVSANFCG